MEVEALGSNPSFPSSSSSSLSVMVTTAGLNSDKGHPEYHQNVSSDAVSPQCALGSGAALTGVDFEAEANKVSEMNGHASEVAVVKIQKVYRSYRTRRRLADSALVAEELWWEAIDYARLNRSTISLFNLPTPETAVSRWNRLRVTLNASKARTGLGRFSKAEILAFQHWIEVIDPRHRYGRNLRKYYDVWYKTSSVQPFFYWLDVGEGKDVDLQECSRSKLREQRVTFLGTQEREDYEYIVVEGKMQKVYRSHRARCRLADSALVAKELWWQAIDYARLNHSTISFFNLPTPETAASRWTRVTLNASKVGKGLGRDSKAQTLAFQHWIEAIDPRHRYGHNLHKYYDIWCKTSSGQPFFYWLDVGEGKGVDLQECSRSKLREQCVKYLGPQEREYYEYIVVEGKIVHKITKELLDTGSGTKWIFVMSTSERLYIGWKKKGKFHHSSFLAGGTTLAAGRLIAEHGILRSISAYSGHYRPTDEKLRSFMTFLTKHGVNLDRVQIDRSIEKSSENYKFQSNATEVLSIPNLPICRLDVGEGKDVDLQECSRSKLREQCVKYLRPQVREDYEYIVVEGKIVHKMTKELLDTGSGTKWMFVMSTSERLYIGAKKKGKFHHSSFLAGGTTLAAGWLTAEHGILQSISAYSRHYRPSDEILRSFMTFLTKHGVNLDRVQINRSTEESSENYKFQSNATTDTTTEVSSIESESRPEKGATETVESVARNYESLSGGLQSPGAKVPKEAILERINSKKEGKSYQLGQQLQRKWSSGAGPRIACIADYPYELRFQALEYTDLSPRHPPPTGSPFKRTAGIASPLGSPRDHSVELHAPDP